MTDRDNENMYKPLEPDNLDQVSGGTFDPNKYTKEMYHSIGISTKYNVIDKDEFMFMGVPISYEQANDMVAIAKRMNSIINDGYQGANKIGYSEKAFIVAFNSQLNAKYGIYWNGAPGGDF